MASALYDKAREAFLSQGTSIDIDGDNIKAALVRTDGGHYAVDLAADEFLDDIAGGDIIATSGNLASKTVAAGVFDAADVTFTTVSGAQVGAVVLYKDTGVAGTSPLIAYIDTATGLPLTPSGSDITVSWSNGASKIFKL